jgi:hypothetical protein
MIGAFYLIRMFQHPLLETVKPLLGAALLGGLLCVFFSKKLINWLPIKNKTQNKTQNKMLTTIVGWVMFSFMVLSFYHLKEIWYEQTYDQMMFLAVSFTVGFSKAFIGKMT